MVLPNLKETNQGDFLKKLSWVLIGAFAFSGARASTNLEMDRVWEGISNQRPDFLWLERKVTVFSGVYAKLGKRLTEIPEIKEEIGKEVVE